MGALRCVVGLVFATGRDSADAHAQWILVDNPRVVDNGRTKQARLPSRSTYLCGHPAVIPDDDRQPRSLVDPLGLAGGPAGVPFSSR